MKQLCWVWISPQTKRRRPYWMRGDAAIARIAQAVAVEPCGGFVNYDSSESCRYCGNINFAPYQSCGRSDTGPLLPVRSSS